MAKKKICIFIGSSIVEFKEERMELENFIHRLSNDFEDRYDTRVIPVVCEAFDPAMARTRKQDDYLESMRGCEMCFFLFYTRAGEYTIEEFREAYQTFLDKGAPKVYVYFKELGQDEKIEPSLTEFMTEVDKTYKHFYNMFSHLDTVKLRILLGIKLNAMDYLPIEVEGNACKVGGHTLEGVDLRNVPEYANSKELAVFGRQLKETEEIYLRMKGQYDAQKGDEAFYREYAQVAAHYHQLKKTVADLRSDLFELMLKLDSTFTSGEITPRMKALQEQYGQDKQRYQQAIMELYRKEKINPIGGCLPILLQIPVFLALYWVLLASVELRDSAWLGWVSDLASPDPWFILPAIMMATMFLQIKLNPTPTDPMQAKMMVIMPLVFGVMFFFFPAGLVLYWLTNNVLSIAQQWYVNKQIAKERAKRLNAVNQ